MEDIDRPLYGITTGFGSLYNVTIPKDELSQLQYNLVVSHACGAGEPVRPEIVKLMLFLKVQNLAYGHSGVQLITVQRLMDMFNEDILPVVYQQGSLGASGDLAPLAHLSLPLIGLGEVMYKGEIRPSAEVWKEKGWEPIKLQSKEGLALLNGTQFMSAHAVWSILKSMRLSRWADLIGAMSLDAFDGRIEPFLPLTHQLRPHTGQISTGKRFMSILAGSHKILQAFLELRHVVPQILALLILAERVEEAGIPVIHRGHAECENRDNDLPDGELLGLRGDLLADLLGDAQGIAQDPLGRRGGLVQRLLQQRNVDVFKPVRGIVFRRRILNRGILNRVLAGRILTGWILNWRVLKRRILDLGIGIVDDRVLTGIDANERWCHDFLRSARAAAPGRRSDSCQSQSRDPAASRPRVRPHDPIQPLYPNPASVQALKAYRILMP
jgi:hypothetical protein